jgi:energy-coupling factor transporter ATP-binding protein EcfA2
MRLTSKGRYAVRAILDLTFNSNGRPVRLQEISERQKISLHYLEQLSFNLPPGAIVGIIGPNGAGKTTLIRTLLGELAPDSGTVTIGADGTAMLVVPTLPDLTTEGDEVIEMVLDMPGVLAHAAATIRDTSQTPPPPPPPPAPKTSAPSTSATVISALIGAAGQVGSSLISAYAPKGTAGVIEEVPDVTGSGRVVDVQAMNDALFS